MAYKFKLTVNMMPRDVTGTLEGSGSVLVAPGALKFEMYIQFMIFYQMN